MPKQDGNKYRSEECRRGRSVPLSITIDGINLKEIKQRIVQGKQAFNQKKEKISV